MGYTRRRKPKQTGDIVYTRRRKPKQTGDIGYTRRRKPTKNTTQHVLDNIMRKQAQIM